MNLKNLILSSCLVLPFGSSASEVLLVSGDVTMNVTENSGGSYDISYSAYGEIFNGDASANPALFVNTRKGYFGHYKSVEKTAEGVKAIAEIKWGTSKNLCLGIDVSEPKKEELDIYYSM